MPIHPLNRRTFIRGFGVCLSLPWLEAMLPFNRSWAAAPSRFATLYIGNGCLNGNIGQSRPNEWNCVGSNSGIQTLAQALAPVAPYQKYLTVVQNCGFGGLHPTGDAAHEQAAPSFLTGMNIRDPNGVSPANTKDEKYPDKVDRLDRNGRSIDRMIADRSMATQKTPLLMASAIKTQAYVASFGQQQMRANLSWDSQTIHFLNETLRTSSEVFKYLTRSGAINPPSGSNPVDPSIGQQKSVLDEVLPEVNTLMNKLGSADKQVMDRYLASLRAVEMDLQASPPPVSSGMCSQPSAAKIQSYKDDQSTTYPTLTATTERMIEMMAMAFQCGVTSSAAMMLSYDWSTIPGSQLSNAYQAGNAAESFYHSVSHYGDISNAKYTICKAVDDWHIRRLAYLANVFSQTRDSDGQTLLDNSLILFGAGMSDPMSHSFREMTRLLLGKGGGLNPGATGKVIDAGGGSVAHPKLLQTILSGFGITDTVGDSGGQTIAGIIK